MFILEKCSGWLGIWRYYVIRETSNIYVRAHVLWNFTLAPIKYAGTNPLQFQFFHFPISFI